MTSKRDIAKAMRAARKGEAYHWPTIAAVLADEIDRLETALSEAQRERDELTTAARLERADARQQWDFRRMAEARAEQAERFAAKVADAANLHAARAEQAERQVRAGLALADEWGDPAGRGPTLTKRDCAAALRAALSGVSGPTTEAGE